MIGIGFAALDCIEHPVFALERNAEQIPVFVEFNEHARLIFNLPAAEVRGKSAWDIFPDGIGRLTFQHHQEAFRTGQRRVYETRLPSGGTSKIYRTTLQPVCDAAGTVLHVVGSSVDLSAQQEIAKFTTGSGKMSSEAETYISLAAHDLRGPMNQVKQIAELLKEDFTDMGDGKYELLDVLDEIGTTAMRLISDVLSYTQATTAKKKCVTFPISDLIGDLLSILDPLKTCRVNVLTQIIYADRTAMQIIIRNLLDNALKYCDPNGTKNGADEDASRPSSPTIVIEVEDLNDGYLLISVKDNGAGFSEPALRLLDGGQMGPDSGYGMLGIRRLIHAEGGTLTVSNRSDGTGAQISFSLPGKIVPASQDEDQNSPD